MRLTVARPAEPANAIRAVVCDWAGVLTNPVAECLGAYCAAVDVAPERIVTAVGRAAARHGHDPFAEMECGRLSEKGFLERIGTALGADGGPPVDLRGFRPAWFAGVRPNGAFLDYLEDLSGRGVTLAVLTNNVREWDAAWRATLPRPEIFSVIVTSCAEGVRKPDPAIYAATLDYLGLPAQACLFVDDVLENCDAARAAGLEAILFRSTAQAIAEIDARLGR
jgi:putative hydrolase of the HAD superfamily